MKLLWTSNVLLEKGQLIVSTPDKEMLYLAAGSRGIMLRKLSLFIVDQLHLIGGQLVKEVPLIQRNALCSLLWI